VCVCGVCVCVCVGVWCVCGCVCVVCVCVCVGVSVCVCVCVCELWFVQVNNYELNLSSWLCLKQGLGTVPLTHSRRFPQETLMLYRYS